MTGRDKVSENLDGSGLIDKRNIGGSAVTGLLEQTWLILLGS